MSLPLCLFQYFGVSCWHYEMNSNPYWRTQTGGILHWRGSGRLGYVVFMTWSRDCSRQTSNKSPLSPSFRVIELLGFWIKRNSFAAVHGNGEITTSTGEVQLPVADSCFNWRGVMSYCTPSQTSSLSFWAIARMVITKNDTVNAYFLSRNTFQDLSTFKNILLIFLLKW